MIERPPPVCHATSDEAIAPVPRSSRWMIVAACMVVLPALYVAGHITAWFAFGAGWISERSLVEAQGTLWWPLYYYIANPEHLGALAYWDALRVVYDAGQSVGSAGWHW